MKKRKSKKKPARKAPMKAPAEVQPKAEEHKELPQEQPVKRSRSIYVGDKVIMTNEYEVPDSIKGLIWTVTAFRYIDGKRCAQLEDYEGCYPVDGLKVVG